MAVKLINKRSDGFWNVEVNGKRTRRRLHTETKRVNVKRRGGGRFGEVRVTRWVVINGKKVTVTLPAPARRV